MNDYSPEVILSSSRSKEDTLDNINGNDNDPNSSLLESEMTNPATVGTSGSTRGGAEEHQGERLVVQLPKSDDSSSQCFAYNIAEDAAGIQLKATSDDDHQAGKPHKDCSTKGGYQPPPPQQQPRPAASTSPIDSFRRCQQHQEQQQHNYHYGASINSLDQNPPSHYGINNHLRQQQGGHDHDVTTEEIFFINNDHKPYAGAPHQQGAERRESQSGVLLPPNRPHDLILLQPPVLQQQQGAGNLFLVTGQGNGTENSDLNFKSNVGAHRTSYTDNHLLGSGGSCLLPQSQNLRQPEHLHLLNSSTGVAELFVAPERNHRLETFQTGVGIHQQADVFKVQEHYLSPPHLHDHPRPRILLKQGKTVDAGTQYSSLVSEEGRSRFISDRDTNQPCQIIIGKNAGTEGNAPAYINEAYLQDRAGSVDIFKINGVESTSAFAHGHPTVDISSSRLRNSRTLLPTGNSVSDDKYPVQIYRIPHHQHAAASSTLLTRSSQYSLNNGERGYQAERNFQPNFRASQFFTFVANKPPQESSSDKKDDKLEKKKKQQKKRQRASQKKSDFTKKRPRRPLTAYNFFFSEERERVLVRLPTINKSTSGEAHGFDRSDAKELHAQGVATTAAKGAVTGAMKLSDRGGEGINIDNMAGTHIICNQLNDANLEALEAKIRANTQRILETHTQIKKPTKAHRKIHGKINFQSLAKTIGGRWRLLSDEKKQYYKDLASKDKLRYVEGMKTFNKIENRINYND